MPRSTASAYCVRSFVPRLAKATSPNQASADRTADGISSITPRSTAPISTPAGCQLRSRPRREGEQQRHVPGVRDHRRHHLDRARDGRPVARPQLGDEQLGPVVGEPERADAEERVLLGRQRQVRDRLVTADVEQPDRDRVAAERLDRLAVGGGLLVLGRRRGPLEEQELGPEQPHAAGPQRAGRRRPPPACRCSRAA